MLCRLEVSNYALIENATIAFDRSAAEKSKKKNGYIAITGETGAGKSILLKALNLLLGERADQEIIRQNENKCVLEASFDLAKLDLKDFFDQNELDYESLCIVRREFSNTGKSRCFVNDTPVQLTILKELGQRLMAIHSQHESLALFDHQFQFEVLDHFAGIQNEVRVYKKNYKTYRDLIQQLQILKETEAQNRKEQDFKSFLLRELEDAQLEKLNVEKLQDQNQRIQNAGKISNSLNKISNLFEADDQGLNDLLRKMFLESEDLVKADKTFEDLKERLLSAKIELEDIFTEFVNRKNELDFSDEEAEQVKEQLDKFNSLAYKHNVQNIADLLTIKKKLEYELSEIESMQVAIEQTEKEISKIEKQLLSDAEKIHSKRKLESAALEKSVKGLLNNLAMPDAELRVEINKLAQPGQNGLDDLDFVFKTNRGGQFLPLKKIASGGELSRLTLSILSLLSETKNLPTLIFDEIDTGVSGEVATKIAAEFARMSKHLQLIAITHLPQVAAGAKDHFHVSKKVIDNKTKTFITKLSEEDRITEVAKMISGEKLSESAMKNAKDLLNIS